jgi:ATPase family protein associated with various cellular activities (AAA)/winged helix domain-containing protein
MLSDAHVAQLRRALAALSAVLGARLADRLPARPTPLPVGEELPPLSGPEALPDVAAFAGDGPLGTVVGDVPLDCADALILTAALAPDVDERYASLLGLLSGRPGTPTGLTGEGARNLAARTFAGRIAAAEHLAPHAPLRAAGLVSLEPAGEDGLLAGRLRIDPDVATWVLGRVREIPDGSAAFPAVPMTTVRTLADVVVPADVRTLLTGLIARIRDRRRIVVDWGFGGHHDGAAGVVALFHGPPGTGKTLAAAVVAREARIPAFRIDLSMLVSKYIGETEKNLARVFDLAERSDCALVFDEADAIFGRRTDVGEARDRYANQEISYLLQRIERHAGVVVLTTNLLANVDAAFLRRIGVVVPFPEPTQVERRQLWEQVFPAALPVARPLDVDRLAERFELTGAQIRDAALEAAYLAADDGQVVTGEHLLAGVRRQYAKSGLMLPAEPR